MPVHCYAAKFGGDLLYGIRRLIQPLLFLASIWSSLNGGQVILLITLGSCVCVNSALGVTFPSPTRSRVDVPQHDSLLPPESHKSMSNANDA